MNRYRIAVCDDDNGDMDDLCGSISHVLEDNGVSHVIDRFISGEGVRDAIVRQKKKYDILFLDILMHEVDGVAAARAIREKDEDVSIVFITSSPNFVFEGYDVQALHYILKPVVVEKLTEVLLYDWNKRNKKNYMDVKLKHSLERIMFDDILYLESRSRKVKITTKKGEYETYGPLGRFMEILPPGMFISCHKSFVVNLNHVSRIAKNGFTTRYNQTVPISKSRYSDSKKAFINFIGQRR